jgi:DHA1 family multidrug resistance protein-like MFS transporter
VNKKAFVIIVSTMFVSMLGMGIVTPFLPIYADQLGASSLEIGLIQASFSIGNFASLLLVGRMSDRFGRKIFLIIGLSMMTLASVAFIWSKNPTQLIMIRLFQGIGASAHLPIAQAYLGDITPEGGEGRWMGYFNAVLFSGIGLGPLVGGVLADAFSMTTPFVVMAIANFVGMVATLIFLPEVPRKVTPREHRSPLAPMKSRVMRGVFAYRMTAGFGTSSLMAFMPLFADVKLGLSTSLIGLLLAVRAPVSFLQSFTGSLSDRYSRRMMVVIGACLAFVAMAYLPMVAAFWPLLFVYLFITLGQAVGMPASNAYVVEEGRTYGMGASMTMFMMAMQVGNGVGPIALGGLANALGLESAFYAAAGLMFLGMVVFLGLVRSKSAAVKMPVPDTTR